MVFHGVDSTYSPPGTQCACSEDRSLAVAALNGALILLAVFRYTIATFSRRSGLSARW